MGLVLLLEIPQPLYFLSTFAPSSPPVRPNIRIKRAMAFSSAVIAVLLLLSPSSLVSAIPTTFFDANGNATHIPKLGAVASESSVCTQIGIDMLEKGGNAIDALVGTVFCVGTIGMYHSGIGGGGFMLVRGPNGTYEFVDFRETAPASYYQDMYVNDTDLSLYGGLAP